MQKAILKDMIVEDVNNIDNSAIIQKWRHYFSIYEKHFSKFIDKSPTIFEIGVDKGGSLRLWKEFFGPNAKTYGIDINQKCLSRSDKKNNIEVYIGDQSDKVFLSELISNIPEIDIVIDDGSHITSHQISSFDILYDRISPYGIYLVEDLHCAYWRNPNLYEQFVDTPDRKTFLDFAREKLHLLMDMHISMNSHRMYYEGCDVSDPTRDKLYLPKTSQFCMSTDSVTFYDSVIVFEKKPRSKPFTTRYKLKSDI